MNDKSPIKIICRIINLLIYTITIFMIYLTSTLLFYPGGEQATNFFENNTKIIIICAIPLLITMIIALILKYTLDEGNRINPYRILDTFTRITTTVPIALISSYYIFTLLYINNIVNTIIGTIIFIIIDRIIILALQETLSVSFIIHDNL